MVNSYIGMLPESEGAQSLGNLPVLEQQQLQNPTAIKTNVEGFPGGAVVKNPPDNAGDMGSSPGPGRSHMPRSN